MNAICALSQVLLTVGLPSKVIYLSIYEIYIAPL